MSLALATKVHTIDNSVGDIKMFWREVAALT
jgi:hypothetical protein